MAVLFESKQRLRISLPNIEVAIAADVQSTDGRSVWIRLREPLIGLEPRHLAKGVQLSFWRTGGWHIAERVRVLTFDLDQGMLQLERPDKTTIIQRRRTFRENIELPVQVSTLTGNASLPVTVNIDSAPETIDISQRKASTMDLSGGGMCLQTSSDTVLDVNQEIRLELDLPTQRVRARGRVRWAQTEEDGHHRYGIAFTRIAEREQDLVFGFLFDLQRSRLRNTV